jgi:hypothetical protein
MIACSGIDPAQALSKMDTCPRSPRSPDLSEVGEIRHGCFSPVYQSSMAHLPILRP